MQSSLEVILNKEVHSTVSLAVLLSCEDLLLLITESENPAGNHKNVLSSAFL